MKISSKSAICSFKKSFFRLCLKVLRLLVRLSVSWVMFQKLDECMNKQTDRC